MQISAVLRPERALLFPTPIDPDEVMRKSELSERVDVCLEANQMTSRGRGVGRWLSKMACI